MPAFWAMLVDVLDEPSTHGFSPEGLRQSPLEHLGANGRWTGPLDSRDDVIQFIEILLRDALTAVVDTCPLGATVRGMSLSLFGFQPFHRSLHVAARAMLGFLTIG